MSARIDTRLIHPLMQSSGLRILSLAAIGWSFWNYEKEAITQFSNSLVEVTSRQSAAETAAPSKLQAIGRAFRQRTTLVGALFIFAYQGIEVSESGWFISYLIEYRNANPAHVGYGKVFLALVASTQTLANRCIVTSGFWGGITVGRFVLVHAARRVGEKNFVFGLGLGVIVFQLLAWLIPDVRRYPIRSLGVFVVAILLTHWLLALGYW